LLGLADKVVSPLVDVCMYETIFLASYSLSNAPRFRIPVCNVHKPSKQKLRNMTGETLNAKSYFKSQEN